MVDASVFPDLVGGNINATVSGDNILFSLLINLLPIAVTIWLLFLRADSAVKVGINRGFAIPCGTPDGTVYVITFLSALATPIARSVAMSAPSSFAYSAHC